MWLLIDDERNLNVDVIARTPEAGKKLLAVSGWTCLCLDHDLGPEQSGYDILNWAILNNLVPERVQLVTSNPVGRSNMSAALENIGYFSVDGINFSKE
jgi:hypothetical protein